MATLTWKGTDYFTSTTKLVFTGDINLAKGKIVEPYFDFDLADKTDTGGNFNFYLYDEADDEFGYGSIEVSGKPFSDTDLILFGNDFEAVLIGLVKGMAEYKGIFDKIISPTIVKDIRGNFISQNEKDFAVLANDGVWYVVPSGFDFQEDADYEVKCRLCNELEYPESDVDIEELVTALLYESPIVESWISEEFGSDEARAKIWKIISKYADEVATDKEWQLETLNGIDLNLDKWQPAEK
jgi:hypothetical protein